MIKIPSSLRQLLEQDIQIGGAVSTYVSAIHTILEDNKLPFFPAYTDHGVQHISNVLQTEVRLIPSSVWQSDLLSAKDAAVLICGTLLHDLGMYLTPYGFLHLVSPDSPFKAVPWFQSRGDSTDQRWSALWHEYLREIRRLSDQQVHTIFGVSRNPVDEVWRIRPLPADVGHWNHYDHLLVGEFLRRHHARLGHEIALTGFPGIKQDLFPRLVDLLPDVADLAGLAARSHGLDLRVVADYLNDTHLTRIRPRGVTALFLMALLRVADYLQLDQKRAPTVLLNLRDPVSSTSAQEWEKHRIVKHIDFDAEDPQAIVIDVSSDHSLQTHLQLDELLKSLQREMDHASAVLSEVYGRLAQERLDQLRLAKTLVHSNLKSESLLNRLPYLPLRGRLGADPQILGLIVEPLYGTSPEVGVRELIQNGVDAVREFHSWVESVGSPPNPLNHPEQTDDVLLEFFPCEAGGWKCRITDKGIGMSPTTVISYFLKAGASFRESNEWLQTFTTDQAQSKIVRSGRFGIGVFATFLLGNSLTVITRHVAREHQGLRFRLQLGQETIELLKVPNAFHGTSIEVELTESSIRRLGLPHLAPSLDWYKLASPTVGIVVRTRKGEHGRLSVSDLQPGNSHELLDYPEWRCISPGASPEILWRIRPYGPSLTVNGIRIAKWVRKSESEEEADLGRGTRILSYRSREEWDEPLYGYSSTFKWEQPEFTFSRRSQSHLAVVPPLALVDRDALVPLTLRRDTLVKPMIPKEKELLEDIGTDIVAWAVASAPANPPPWDDVRDLRVLSDHYPLLCRGEGVSWFAPFITANGFGVIDPWLLQSCGVNILAISGYIEGFTPEEESSEVDLATFRRQHHEVAFDVALNCTSLPEGIAWTAATWLWGDKDIYDQRQRIEVASERFWSAISATRFFDLEKGYRVSAVADTSRMGDFSSLAMLEQLAKAGGAIERHIRPKEGWISITGRQSSFPEIDVSTLIPGEPRYGKSDFPERFPCLLEVHRAQGADGNLDSVVAKAWAKWIGDCVIPWESRARSAMLRRLDPDQAHRI